MLFAWILLLYSSVQFVSSEAELLNGTSCSAETLRECNVSACTTQNWVNCRYHSDCLHGGSCELDSNSELSCKCKAGWTGRDCSETCKNGKECVCPEGWGGYHCDVAMVSIKSFEELSCTTGVFIDGTCICDPGFHGVACNVFNCSRGECGVHGKCSINATYCECDSGFHGATCNVFNCSQGGCGVHGKCSRNATYCECDSGFHGTTCNAFNCSQGGCGANGKCSDDASHCECDMGWSGSFCELENWITFQRRMIFDIEFNKTFSEYEQGFGDKKGDGDFWLGLKTIHDYTKNGTWELRIEVVAFNGSRFYSEYSGFRVLDPPLYKITWSAWTGGNLGNDKYMYAGMYPHQGAPFSARDRDQDNDSSRDCSNAYGLGGWWFDSCSNVYLNTDRQTSSNADLSRMRWWSGRERIPLIGSTMKMRRVE